MDNAMQEKSLLSAILADPDNPSARFVYADWLEEQGTEIQSDQAEFLRLECQFTKKLNQGATDLTLLQALRELATDLNPDWTALVSRLPIENCTGRQGCPGRWECLERTTDSRIRHCQVCQAVVYHCTSIQVAQMHLHSGDCMVLDHQIRRTPGDLDSPLPNLPRPRRQRRPRHRRYRRRNSN